MINPSVHKQSPVTVPSPVWTPSSPLPGLLFCPDTFSILFGLQFLELDHPLHSHPPHPDLTLTPCARWASFMDALVTQLDLRTHPRPLLFLSSSPAPCGELSYPHWAPTPGTRLPFCRDSIPTLVSPSWWCMACLIPDRPYTTQMSLSPLMNSDTCTRLTDLLLICPLHTSTMAPHPYHRHPPCLAPCNGFWIDLCRKGRAENGKVEKEVADNSFF